LYQQYAHETLQFSTLMDKAGRVSIAPLQFDDVDTGDDAPARCLSRALWLANDGDVPYAVLLSEQCNYSERNGWRLEIGGPPGTGKTHTIRYLAASLPGHTTLLITADQVANIEHYMTLARLLSPSVLVIEDADLIARQREDMHGPCEEVLLNRLLNEMDGLT